MEADEAGPSSRESASPHASLAQQSPALKIGTHSLGDKQAGTEFNESKTNQDGVVLPLFGTQGVSEEGSSFQSGIMMHVGGPVWALDWCPQRINEVGLTSVKPQFLAVGVHPPNVSNIPSGKAFKGHGSVQIWQVDEGPSSSNVFRGKDKQRRDSPREVLGKSAEDLLMESVLPTHAHVTSLVAHNGLLTWDLKWRPPGQWMTSQVTSESIGQLAAAIGDGSVQVWTVPAPEADEVRNAVSPSTETAARKRKRKEHADIQESPPLIHLPSAGFSTGHPDEAPRLPLTLEWSPCAPMDLLLAGCHDGTVLLWRVPESEAASSSEKPVYPLTCVKAEDSPVRALAWVPPDIGGSNSLFISGGHKGLLKFWDVRDPLQPAWTMTVSRGWLLKLDWLSVPRCFMVARDDGLFQVWSVDCMGSILPGCEAPYASTMHAHVRKLASGALWGVSANRQTGLVAAGSSNGVVSYFQMTRRWIQGGHSSNRHMQPAHQCAVLKAGDEKSPLSIRLIPSGDPLVIKKEADLANKAVNVESEGPAVANTSTQKNGKRGTGNRKPLRVIEQVKEREEGSKDSGSPFPPRKVAIQNVVWNPNKRYSAWLAWGGQAGILCCQRVHLPEYDVITPEKRT